jgi:ligand-binding SRPBCC domain-containing protein
MNYTIRNSTHLTASKSEVWEWITSIDGISKEMSPYLRMSAPRGVKSLASINFIPGEKLFRSWITLFKLLPVDYSDLTLESLDQEIGFVEQSRMGSMRSWRHVRTITPDKDGCTLTDEVSFEPKFGGPILSKVVEAFFNHRHRMLSKYLGGA